MFSPEQLDALMKEAMAELGKQDSKGHNKIQRRTCGQNGKFNLTPAQALVIVGLLSGALNVFSVLVDADQLVSIVLRGSLKKEEKSELDKIMAQIGTMPFDEVVKAMLKRIR
ncbi:hypothetical protein [Thermotalea metallivorans]|uniref:Uncharacterized protein n=1 Tax=Thermotalea metallivorans TaxID=520762 RepID=A0A140L783_9FIRM|nr:hypothetical protein [Thermotalea metallivorans]KXG76408.1 hypothetical protein AN619_09390 [Thermotalea metallivorans]